MISGRSLVLTPSNDAAEAIRDHVKETLNYPTFAGADLETGKDRFVAAPTAVAVVANRYDGIDFPDDDCRLQFVEGLPRAANLQERFLMSRMSIDIACQFTQQRPDASGGSFNTISPLFWGSTVPGGFSA
jgi:hypothetical protein